MRRFCLLALLTLLSSSAHAGSFSFSVSGRRIHIESSRYCRSSSCASVSISGISQSRRKRDDGDRDNGEPMRPSAAPVAVPPPAVIQPMITPSVAPAPPPPAVYKPAAAVTQTVPAPPIQPAVVAPQRHPPCGLRSSPRRRRHLRRSRSRSKPCGLRRHRQWRVFRTRPTTSRPIRRAATGRPKAGAKCASLDAAARCAAMSSTRPRTTGARRC